ncbi:uncharacterized protein L203_105905 [Cryptococcus depauperatus CBS 7841]|uniref:Uncharacterized protein n=1 Tax=Cryptococcus depauperatus CBS 7841 TaxID=1295531 RepID=A0A1E3HJ41_9TREE|nr:hypothetical protein L203_06419 [Cryptococcus depauperatus CBS 7841]
MTREWLPPTGNEEQTQAGSAASIPPSNATQPDFATLLDTRRGQLSKLMTSVLANELAWARMKSGTGDGYYAKHMEAALADINNNPPVKTTIEDFVKSVFNAPRRDSRFVRNEGVVPKDGFFRLVGQDRSSNERREAIVKYSSLGYDPNAIWEYTDKDRTDLSAVSGRLTNQTLASLASYGMPNSTIPPNASSALPPSPYLPVAKSTDVGEKMESCIRDHLKAIKEDYGLSDNMPLWGLSAGIQSVNVDKNDLMLYMRYSGGNGSLNGETIQKGMVLTDIGKLNLEGNVMDITHN